MAHTPIEELEADVLTFACEWVAHRKVACYEAMKGVNADPNSWTRLGEAETKLTRAVERYLGGDTP